MTIRTPTTIFLSSEQTQALDNPIWSALTRDQEHLSEGAGLARRYDPTVSVFAGMKEPNTASYDALGKLISDGRLAVLFTPQPLAPPSFYAASALGEGYQMILGDVAKPFQINEEEATELSLEDVPDMEELVALTKPGPFTARTIELGHYLGVRQNDVLVAMVGERMRFDGFVEISAVCVHPDHRGKGLAQRLMIELSSRIASRGEIPFLHVYVGNTSAIALYEKLGFVRRQRMQVTGLTIANVAA